MQRITTRRLAENNYSSTRIGNAENNYSSDWSTTRIGNAENNYSSTLVDSDW